MRKTMSFAGVHFCVAFLVGWLLSGDPLIGGAIALVEPMVNTVAYHFHERAWQGAARRSAGASPPAAWGGARESPPAGPRPATNPCQPAFT